MKPTLEDVLSVPYNDDDFAKCSKQMTIAKNVLKVSDSCSTCVEKVIKDYRKQMNEEFDDKSLQQMIVDELSGQCFSEYVKFFKSHYKDCLKKSGKKSEKSVKARIKANELLTKKTHSKQIHEEIWELYSKSIAFAPVGSKDLVLAYECRSNFLLHLKKYEDCIRDIDRALAITDFDLLKVKLLCRKMTCFVAIDKDINERKKLWVTIKCHFEKIDGVFKDERFMKLIKEAKNDLCSESDETTEKDENYSMPLVSYSNVTIKSNKNLIQLVANQDFLPGEAILVTKPIIACNNPDKCYAYCSHCLSFMWAGIPCNECTLCMYCSEECKAQAWDKYHMLECKVLPHINFDSYTYYDLQASLKLFVVGFREFGSISKLKEEIDKLKDLSKSVKFDKLFDSDFLNLFVTTVPMYKTDLQIIKKHIKIACFLMAHVIQTLDIFVKDAKSMKGRELAKDDVFIELGFVLFQISMSFSDFVLSPIEIHLQRPTCTVHGDNTKACLKSRCDFRGKVFDPFREMMERSCNPNTSCCWSDDGKIIYYCVQPLNKMEKITFGTEEFYKTDGARRKSCGCTACRKKWPNMSALFKKYDHRRAEPNTLKARIVQKYLERNNLKTDVVEDNNCVFSLEGFEELKKDAYQVVKVCGQPSFASSLMISFLCKAFEKFYGTVSLQSRIPANC